jgi:hypothetical protein
MMIHLACYQTLLRLLLKQQKDIWWEMQTATAPVG